MIAQSSSSLTLLDCLRARNGIALLGFLSSVGMMSVGYFYNLAFVQRLGILTKVLDL